MTLGGFPSPSPLPLGSSLSCGGLFPSGRGGVTPRGGGQWRVFVSRTGRRLGVHWGSPDEECAVREQNDGLETTRILESHPPGSDPASSLALQWWRRPQSPCVCRTHSHDRTVSLSQSSPPSGPAVIRNWVRSLIQILTRPWEQESKTRPREKPTRAGRARRQYLGWGAGQASALLAPLIPVCPTEP